MALILPCPLTITNGFANEKTEVKTKKNEVLPTEYLVERLVCKKVTPSKVGILYVNVVSESLQICKKHRMSIS